MFTLKRFLLLIVTAALVVSIGIVTQYSKLEQKIIAQVLEDCGLEPQNVGEVQRNDERVIITQIALDDEKYSVIEGISFENNWLDTLTGKVPTQIRIQNIKLTGELDKDWGLSIEGWNTDLNETPKFSKIFIEHVQLDLLTRWGGLRFEGKGQINKDADGGIHLNSVIWGAQNQLRLQAKLETHYTTQGTWTTQLDINEASLLLPDIETSRVSGWLSLESGQSLLPHFSGQIFAGKMNLGYVDLSETKITIDGSTSDIQAIIEGKIPGSQDSIFNVDVSNADAGLSIQANIEGPSHKDLIQFLQRLQATLQLKTFKSGILTPLMITEGNVVRIYNMLDKTQYETAKVVLNGSLYDMTGKIITSRNVDGKIRNNVISLDPSSL